MIHSSAPRRRRSAPAALRLPAALLLAVLAACGGDDGTGPIPSSAMGSITITTSTTGPEPDVDGYTVAVDGGTAQTIGTAGSLTLPHLVAGHHTVTLGGVAAHCAVSGGSTQTVSVVGGDTVTAAFSIACSEGTLLFFGARDEGDGTSNDEIYAINPDGTGLRQLTVTPVSVRNQYPSWSPDGSKIVFMSDRDGKQQIFVMNADGTGVTRISNGAGDDNYPAWSPDGTTIAFAADRGGDSPLPDGVVTQIYTMDASGGNVRALTADSLVNSWPAWSPDGKRIAFMSASPDTLRYRLTIMDSDGGNRHVLSDTSTFILGASWSPDGSRIAAAVVGPMGRVNIVTMAIDGSDRRQLTNDDTIDNFAPSWSPGGKRIAFCRDSDLYVMNSDGTNLTYVTTYNVHGGKACRVDWGP